MILGLHFSQIADAVGLGEHLQPIGLEPDLVVHDVVVRGAAALHVPHVRARNQGCQPRLASVVRQSRVREEVLFAPAAAWDRAAERNDGGDGVLGCAGYVAEWGDWEKSEGFDFLSPSSLSLKMIFSLCFSCVVFLVF